MFKKVIGMLNHNPKHSIKVFNNRVCARCFSLYASGTISFILFAVLYITGFEFSFLPIFVISWVMSGICIADWLSVKLKLRKGSNKWRVLSGACLGIAYSLYVWLLPIPWILKLLSLMIINSFFAIVFYYVRCKEHNLSLKNPISQNIRSIAVFSAVPLAVGTVPCGCSQTGGCCGSCACPGCNMTCCCSPVLVCCCTLPLLCFLPTILKWFKGRKKSSNAKPSKGRKTK